ncbi:unnamed protein product [Callosobruchus maculatus]|uniref:Uncharacterized protein n=1 Tax=Callosobruchus maculatus TaxID=64391 RepID=A0A653BSZ1_CALMS|nr:unnamed protein product [Callosobruchus maculatus]
MDHLAQDLTIALEESETCDPSNIAHGRWGIRRRTRSAGNLHLYVNKSGGNNHSEDSSSSNSEIRNEKHRNKLVSFHQSDSDDMSFSVVKALRQKAALRMKHPVNNFLRGVSHSLESDSVNEHSPARPNLRRKRKLKRISIDETPVPPCGKRKRSQRLELMDTSRHFRHSVKIKPLHQSLVNKIEKFCQGPGQIAQQSCSVADNNSMEVQHYDDNWDGASESSISWSGGEGHEGDDELTDWAPPMDNAAAIDQPSWPENDPREIRAEVSDFRLPSRARRTPRLQHQHRGKRARGQIPARHDQVGAAHLRRREGEVGPVGRPVLLGPALREPQFFRVA